MSNKKQTKAMRERERERERERACDGELKTHITKSYFQNI